MSKYKLSKWHPEGTCPVHFGLYQVKDRYGLLAYSYWNGETWHYLGWFNYYDNERVAKEYAIDSYNLGRTRSDLFVWRGIVK